MSTHIVTPADELEIIHLLAAGTRTPAQVARRTGVAELIVCEVAKKHGWPHLGRLADSAKALRKKLGQKEPGAELDEAATDAPTATPTRVPPKPTQAAQQPSGRSLADLRRRAEPWPHLLARVEYAAKKLSAVADSIAEAEQRAEAKQASKVAELERRRKIKELEDEISELKAERPRATSGTPRQTGDSKIIRAWADANGVECSRYGHIPKAVRAAYEAQR